MPAEKVRVGDLKRRVFTLPQAARVLNMDAGLLRKTVDRGWLDKTYVQHHGRRFRALDGIDLVCLIVGETLSSKVRNTLYVQLKHWPEDRLLAGTMELQVEVPSGRRTVDVSLGRSVQDALAAIHALERTLDAIGDDGRICGTDVEAHRIAALMDGGMSVDEVLRDYANLNAAQVDSAIAYARANPKQGRPYPVRTAKSALRTGKGGLARAFAAARDDG